LSAEGKRIEKENLKDKDTNKDNNNNNNNNNEESKN
jgi:hypothetical protein